MDAKIWLVLGQFILSVIALIGFFWTKAEGFGRYTTSAFLLLVALIFSVNLFAAEQMDAHVLSNVVFAIIGFAGGLLSQKDESKTAS